MQINETALKRNNNERTIFCLRQLIVNIVLILVIDEKSGLCWLDFVHNIKNEKGLKFISENPFSGS